MSSTSRPQDDDQQVELTRTSFRRLLAANPNYFGTFPGLGFEPVQEQQGNGTYEGISCVSYNQQRDRIEATVDVRLPSGYGGGLCTPGTFEHLRFYVDYGSGWEDAGPAAINVHDIPVGRDCPGDPTHPLSYVAGVPHTPHRRWCGTPVLPRVRAILSWELAPTPGDPDFSPIWGDVHECNVQIAPRRFFFHDVLQYVPEKVLTQLPSKVLQEVPLPHPNPDPGPLLALPELVELYADAEVPAHRFALPHLQESISAPTTDALLASAQLSQISKVNLEEILKALESTSGNVDYEELECLGLDQGLSALVATFNVKRASGYSGGPCTAGSTEYVAFWADWDDSCGYTYLGTVEVAAHDYVLPDGGLCYAAIQPVDLGALRRSCDTPVLRRVRAVLSWGTTPSTTDPDAVPYWGNRIDRHVQVEPGRPYDGTAHFTIVGGVAAQSVSLSTGLTLPGAKLGTSTLPLDPPDCPFAGLVKLQGPNDPSLAPHSYRVVAHNVDDGGTTILTSPFTVVDSNGFAHTVTPNATTGFTSWPTWQTNTEGTLGVHAPGGEDRWDYRLELDAPGAVVDTARVQMDNLVRNVVDPLDPVNAGDLHLDTAGACKVPHGILTGSFVARDLHFASWSIGLTGGNGDPIPPITTTPTTTTTQTPLAGTPFTMDLSDPHLAPCGYVVRLTITDRAVVNSSSFGHTTYVERGICLE